MRAQCWWKYRACTRAGHTAYSAWCGLSDRLCGEQDSTTHVCASRRRPHKRHCTLTRDPRPHRRHRLTTHSQPNCYRWLRSTTVTSRAIHTASGLATNDYSRWQNDVGRQCHEQRLRGLAAPYLSVIALEVNRRLQSSSRGPKKSKTHLSDR